MNLEQRRHLIIRAKEIYQSFRETHGVDESLALTEIHLHTESIVAGQYTLTAAMINYVVDAMYNGDY